jgi:Domain of unknown function (DUF5606)
MEYREIVAVTGLSGLFQLLATKSDGAIVRNLADKSTKFISARMHNVTPLESIEVYTISDNVRLHEVFQKMKDNEASTPLVGGKADNNTVKAYFKSIFPEFDEERVYVSDMKKMLKWYELLKANNLLNFEYLLHEAEEETEAPAQVDEAAEEKPAKKAKAKKAEPADEAAAEGEEKPAKKATAKKKKAEDTDADTAEEKPAKKAAAKKKKSEE